MKKAAFKSVVAALPLFQVLNGCMDQTEFLASHPDITQEDLDYMIERNYLPVDLINTSFDFGLNMTSLQRYANVQIPASDLTSFTSLLLQCNVQSSANNEFVHIVAPSLSGKTQLSVSLEHSCQHSLFRLEDREAAPLRAVLRFCMASYKNGATQDICKSMYFSESLQSAAEIDLEAFRRFDVNKSDHSFEMQEIVSCLSLREIFTEKESIVCGLIYSMLDGRIRKLDTNAYLQHGIYRMDCVPKSFSALNEYLNANFRDKPCVIFLDEFSPSTRNLFLRNIMRCLTRCVVVLMGCDSGALTTSIPSVLRGDISRGSPKFWAQVVTRPLSPNQEYFVAELIALENRVPTEFLPVLSWLKSFPCERPGFMRFYIDALTEGLNEGTATSPVGFLEAALSRTFSRLQEAKGASVVSDEQWLYGQWSMHFPCANWRRLYPSREQTSCSHFAFLSSFVLNSPLPFFGLGRGTDGTLFVIPWMKHKNFTYKCSLLPGGDVKSLSADIPLVQPLATTQAQSHRFPRLALKTQFPSYEGDELSYLCLIGGHSSVFGADNTTHSISKRLLELRRQLDGQHADINGSVDGSFIEHQAMVALTHASKCRGIAGCTLGEFIAAIVGELLPIRLNRLALEAPELTSELLSMRVPFCPVLQGHATDSLCSIPGTHTGCIQFARNHDSIDGIILPDCLFGRGGAADDTRSDILITFEEKKRSSDVTSTILGKSLGGVKERKINLLLGEVGTPLVTLMPRCHVHFFFVSRLSNTCWSEIPLDEQVPTFLVDSLNLEFETLNLRRMDQLERDLLLPLHEPSSHQWLREAQSHRDIPEPDRDHQAKINSLCPTFLIIIDIKTL